MFSRRCVGPIRFLLKKWYDITIATAGFRSLIPIGKELNLRLVLLNLRGYPGSTPYSDDELELFGGSPNEQGKALKARGFELATFLRWFIEKESIPQIHTAAGGDKAVGGLSILAWSGGNSQTMPLFAYADELPEETQALLDKYLRSFIMYGKDIYVVLVLSTQ